MPGAENKNEYAQALTFVPFLFVCIGVCVHMVHRLKEKRKERSTKLNLEKIGRLDEKKTEDS